MATTSVGQPLRSVGEPGVRATQAPNAGDLATEEGHAGVPNFTRTNSKETLSRLKHQRAGSPESCSSARLNLRQNRSVHYEDDEAFHNSMFGEPRNSPARTDMSDDPFRQERLQYFASQLVQYDYGKGRKNSIIIDGVTFEGLGSVKDALESRRLENMHRRGPLHELAWFVEAGTFVIFAVASVVMVTLWAVEHEQADAFVTTFFVTAIAAAAYFAKTCHMGDFKIHDNWVPIARYQGHEGIDTDIPSWLETFLFTTTCRGSLDHTFRKFVFMFFQIFAYALRPCLLKPDLVPFDRWMFGSWVFQLAFDAAMVACFGPKVMLYLLLSTFFAGSIHPTAGHFLAEHYVMDGKTETYSYYGPLNRVTYNVGYHNEHHDFPNVPWSNLPKVRQIAHEFYDDLPRCESWPGVIIRFIFDDTISLFSRVKREPKEKKQS